MATLVMELYMYCTYIYKNIMGGVVLNSRYSGKNMCAKNNDYYLVVKVKPQVSKSNQMKRSSY